MQLHLSCWHVHSPDQQPHSVPCKVLCLQSSIFYRSPSYHAPASQAGAAQQKFRSKLIQGTCAFSGRAACFTTLIVLQYNESQPSKSAHIPLIQSRPEVAAPELIENAACKGTVISAEVQCNQGKRKIRVHSSFSCCPRGVHTSVSPLARWWRGESLSESSLSVSRVRVTPKQLMLVLASAGSLKSLSSKRGNASSPPGSRLYTPAVYLQQMGRYAVNMYGTVCGGRTS